MSIPKDTYANAEELRARVEELEARIAELEELLARRSFASSGQEDSDVVVCLRYHAQRTRAHSGFDPGARYDKTADDIQAALAPRAMPSEPKQDAEVDPFGPTCKSVHPEHGKCLAPSGHHGPHGTDRNAHWSEPGWDRVKAAAEMLHAEVQPAAKASIKHMVDRFLGWKLPEDFSPDDGISFKATYNDGTPYVRKHEPVGTNLFSATQAEAMVRYMLAGMPDSAPIAPHALVQRKDESDEDYARRVAADPECQAYRRWSELAGARLGPAERVWALRHIQAALDCVSWYESRLDDLLILTPEDLIKALTAPTAKEGTE